MTEEEMILRAEKYIQKKYEEYFNCSFSDRSRNKRYYTKEDAKKLLEKQIEFWNVIDPFKDINDLETIVNLPEFIHILKQLVDYKRIMTFKMLINLEEN